MNELYHHGIKGQKWGVRRFQNKDGSYTAAGEKRYGRKIQKAEKKAVNNNPSNKGVLKRYRTSTGENYDKAVSKFQASFKNDPEYQKLSKRAFDVEKKRLLAERDSVGDYWKTGNWDEKRYDDYINSDKYKQLEDESAKATAAKEAYVREKARTYVDTIKEAKLKDIGMIDNIDLGKKYISDNWYNYYWDGNLDYNTDNYYEPGVENVKYKKP